MLAFATIVNPTEVKAGKAIGQQDIWIVNADGTARRRVTDGNGVNATPAWSPDGRVYFVSDRNGQEAIWSAQVLRGRSTVVKTE
jgi:TolB protein